MLPFGERSPSRGAHVAFDRYERRWESAILRLKAPYVGPLPDDDPIERPQRLGWLGGLTITWSARRNAARQDAERAQIILGALSHDPDQQRRALVGHIGPPVKVEPEP